VLVQAINILVERERTKEGKKKIKTDTTSSGGFEPPILPQTEGGQLRHEALWAQLGEGEGTHHKMRGYQFLEVGVRSMVHKDLFDGCAF
jgi:hypothetical protein